ncbi:MAG: hypothetical protein ACK42C_04130 [Aquificaceae bacterium]|jgi:hypothetical protein|uniref:hypothetical protein n=1 Tax=Hydrogenobacter sp. Uz 6-8 TaxID=3384828 RepID=UPI000F1947FC|nr:MAG: hypothetical protein D6804_02225 [Aquificota bacterium]
MKKLVLLSAALMGLSGVSAAGDRVYLSLGVNLGYPSCPERRVVYADRSPDVVIIRPTPVYYYAPYEKVVIIEKRGPKRWKKHPRWDW